MSRQTVENLYQALRRLDGVAMEACYAPQARFDDAIFSLQGRERIGGMWRMLTEATRARGQAVWQLRYSGVQADQRHGQAHWDADYRFSATGRMVHNHIASRFEFTPEGLILRQQDHFNFWRWSGQALGLPGWLLGWSPMLRAKVRAQAASRLDQFMAQRQL